MPRVPTFRGQPLTAQDLEQLRLEIEGFATIEVIDDEMRALIAAHWPHLLDKIRAPVAPPRARAGRHRGPRRRKPR
jgi:hypothetical protein